MSGSEYSDGFGQFMDQSTYSRSEQSGSKKSKEGFNINRDQNQIRDHDPISNPKKYETPIGAADNKPRSVGRGRGRRGLGTSSNTSSNIGSSARSTSNAPSQSTSSVAPTEASTISAIHSSTTMNSSNGFSCLTKMITPSPSHEYIHKIQLKKEKTSLTEIYKKYYNTDEDNKLIIPAYEELPILKVSSLQIVC